MRTRPLIASPPWTAEDDELLRAVLAAGTDTVTIAARLLRSQSAIGLANSGYCCPLLARAGNRNWHGAAEDDGEMTRPWTDDEVHRLIAHPPTPQMLTSRGSWREVFG